MNVKTRKALGRISEGRARAGDDARVERHADRQHAAKNNRAKLAKPRKHKQHVHPLRDESGAFTWVGRTTLFEAVDDGTIKVVGYRSRKWLAGISAQRGY